MGGGRSGTPAPCLSMSYLRDEENTCDWFTLQVTDRSEWGHTDTRRGIACLQQVTGIVLNFSKYFLLLCLFPFLAEVR